MNGYAAITIVRRFVVGVPCMNSEGSKAYIDNIRSTPGMPLSMYQQLLLIIRININTLVLAQVLV